MFPNTCRHPESVLELSKKYSIFLCNRPQIPSGKSTKFRLSVGYGRIVRNFPELSRNPLISKDPHANSLHFEPPSVQIDRVISEISKISEWEGRLAISPPTYAAFKYLFFKQGVFLINSGISFNFSALRGHFPSTYSRL